MIVNGACKYKDWDYFNMVLQEDFKGMDVKLEHNQDNALLAIQGTHTHTHIYIYIYIYRSQSYCSFTRDSSGDRHNENEIYAFNMAQN